MSAHGGRRSGVGDPVAAAVARTFREERAGVLATLIRHVGDFQLAEDAVQDAFAKLSPTPVVELNRAAAVGFAEGPQAGLDLLEPLLGDPALERYQPLHAAHAELLRRAGHADGAARAAERAIALSANAVERAELERRLRALRAG